MPEKLLPYKIVRAMFGWEDNRTIRDYVAKGLLTRVCLSANTKSHYITASSALALEAHPTTTHATPEAQAV